MLEQIKKYKFLFFSLFIAIILELTVFNYPAIRTVLNGNLNIEVPFEIEDNTIFVSDINTKLTSMNIQLKNAPSKPISYSVFYTSLDYILTPVNPKTFASGTNHDINFDTHSECKQLEMDIKTDSDYEISSILLNHPNFHFSFLRIMITFLIAFFIFQLKEGKIFTISYDETSKSQKYTAILCISIFCIFILLFSFIQMRPNTLLIRPDDIPLTDTLFLQTEAFLQNRISLPVKVSDQLISLENPYNYDERILQKVPCLFDTAYYNGNYYSYFGITPIILFILPFRAITGCYLPLFIFNLIFIFAAIFLLFDVYRKLIHKTVKHVSLFHFYLGFFTILFASNILQLLLGRKYDIVECSGVTFILLAIDLALRLSSTKYKYPKAIGIGLSLALAILSKPSFIIYFPLVAFLLISIHQNFTKEEKIKGFLCIFIPLSIFGIFQMCYNAIRFDNIFEFGAKYQLTTSDMNYCMSFTFGKFFTGLMQYIFKLPIIDVFHFPFVTLDKNVLLTMSTNEICFQTETLGLIAIPILWVFCFRKFIIKKQDNSFFYWFYVISLITATVSIILITTVAGISNLYSIDFKFILTLVAIILLLKLVENKQYSPAINRLFILLCFATILIALPISFSPIQNTTPFSTFITHLFEFWT